MKMKYFCKLFFRVHHYSIERDEDGMVWIPGGKKFIGPVELVRYHSQFIAGFLTRPSKPCDRGPGEIPMVFKGVPMYEMEQKVIELLKSRKIRVSGVHGVLYSVVVDKTENAW